jgi:hypothetical protein
MARANRKKTKPTVKSNKQGSSKGGAKLGYVQFSKNNNTLRKIDASNFYLKNKENEN